VTEIVKLLAVIAVIILLIKKKWKLEYVILLASLLVGAFFNLSLIQIGNNFVLALIDPTTLKLIGIIVLVYILSGVLRKVESLRDLVDSLQGLVKDYRLILAFIPALLGLIPMPAGAMFSAPMVKEVGGRVGLTPEEETFINYWFRHIWEFVWPLFPGIILFAGLLKVEIQEVILVQFPLTIATIIVGFVWEYKNLRKDTTLINRKDILFNLKKLFFGIWPILLIIILVLGTKTDLLFSLAIVILSLIFLNIKKLSLKMLKEIIRNDINLSVVILIASIMIFKRILQVSGGIEIIPEAFAKLGIHPFIVLFTIPFFIAAMTGVGTAALGIGLPVLLPIIIVQGETNLYYAMLAFTGSFSGVMISPMHLCLVVTKNYFKADMGKIYKMLTLPLIIISLSALALVMVRT
jgi:integral membrane protein (TIGR00529 family)